MYLHPWMIARGLCSSSNFSDFPQSTSNRSSLRQGLLGSGSIALRKHPAGSQDPLSNTTTGVASREYQLSLLAEEHS